MKHDSRIEKRPDQVFIGLAHHYMGEMGQEAGEKQWNEFMSLDAKIGGRKDDRHYGLCMYGDSSGNMTYVCAVEVDALAPVAEPLTRFEVPASSYAVFTHTGNISAISDSWAQVFEELLPGEGLDIDGDVSFELYDSRFDPKTGDGEVEIWIPVKE